MPNPFKQIENVVGSHYSKSYPYVEEDSEAVATWESARKVRMRFKGITVQEGYERARKKFGIMGRLYSRIHITMEGGEVVITF